jgi:hypothetical protein
LLTDNTHLKSDYAEMEASKDALKRRMLAIPVIRKQNLASNGSSVMSLPVAGSSSSASQPMFTQSQKKANGKLSQELDGFH